MDFDQARAAAGAGARIRRADWDSFLVMSTGRLVWDLPRSLIKACDGSDNPAGDPGYAVTVIDVAARDWTALS